MCCPCCDSDKLDGSKFCIACGGPLRPRCPRCGADNLPRAKFSREYDTSLTGQIPAFYPSLSSARLSYTPGHAVEKILTSKSTLEGERKQVTMLFANFQEAKVRFKEVL
jgi:Double zinc ribbon